MEHFLNYLFFFSQKADKLKLKPSELVIGNVQHQKLLQEMGVQIVSVQDGRLHLQHMPSIVSLRQFLLSHNYSCR